jgi:hypothetical protein
LENLGVAREGNLVDLLFFLGLLNWGLFIFREFDSVYLFYYEEDLSDIELCSGMM